VTWKTENVKNRNTLFLAPPAIYGPIALGTGDKLKLDFAGLMTRSAQVSAALSSGDSFDVRIGLTEAGVDGTNSFPVGLSGFAETFQASQIWIKNVGGPVTVSAAIVLSDVAVEGENGGVIDSANGFDGGDTSDAVTVIEAE
jgi:hypothetical protein